jgi:hypothetical protein
MMMPRTMPTMLLMPRDCPFNPLSTCGNNDEYNDAKDHANDTADA